MRDLWQTPLKGLTGLGAIVFGIAFVEGEPLDKTPHILWVPHVGADTIAYINNARSGEGETRTNVLLGTGQEALIYNIPRIQLLPGRNRIDIYVKSDPTRSGLGPVYLGPSDRIAKQIKRSVILSQMLPIVAYVAALFALILNLLAILTSNAFFKHGGLSLACASLVVLYQVGGGWPVLTLVIGVVIYAVVIIREGKLKPLNVLLISTALSGPILLSFRTLGPVVFPDPSLILTSIWLAPLPIIVFPPIKGLLKALAERRSRFDELEEALDDTKDNLEKEIRRRAVLEERERLTRDAEFVPDITRSLEQYYPSFRC